MVDEIGVERKGALEFGDGGAVPALDELNDTKVGRYLGYSGRTGQRRRKGRRRYQMSLQSVWSTPHRTYH
jgi:hypothetical protein